MPKKAREAARGPAGASVSRSWPREVGSRKVQASVMMSPMDMFWLKVLIDHAPCFAIPYSRVHATADMDD